MQPWGVEPEENPYWMRLKRGEYQTDAHRWELEAYTRVFAEGATAAGQKGYDVGKAEGRREVRDSVGGK